MFTWVAPARPEGNKNNPRTCYNCGGKMYVGYNDQSYRCPHCDYKQ